MTRSKWYRRHSHCMDVGGRGGTGTIPADLITPADPVARAELPELVGRADPVARAELPVLVGRADLVSRAELGPPAEADPPAAAEAEVAEAAEAAAADSSLSRPSLRRRRGARVIEGLLCRPDGNWATSRALYGHSGHCLASGVACS